MLNGALGLPHGDWRVGANGLPRLQCSRHQVVGRADPVDHAPFKGLLRGERATAQDDFLGAAHADRSRESLSAAGAWHNPERDLGQREAGAARRVDEIAAQGEFATASIGGAIDRRDDRNGAIDHSADAALRQPMASGPFFEGLFLPFLQVGAGAKRPRACAGEDNATNLAWLPGRLLEQRQQFGGHSRIGRVGGLGPVERCDQQARRRLLDLKRVKGFLFKHGGQRRVSKRG